VTSAKPSAPAAHSHHGSHLTVPGANRKHGGLRPATPEETDQSMIRTSIELSKSFDGGAVSSLLLRFKALNKDKRHVLLKVLKDLEDGDVKEVDPSLRLSLQILKVSITTVDPSLACQTIDLIVFV
jgi:hypothetical protein